MSNDEHGHPTPPIEAPARLLRVRLRGSSGSDRPLTRSPHKYQGVPVLTNLRRHRSAYVLTGAAASWGLATVIAKSALTEIPPVALLPIQLAASVLLVTPVLLARQRQEPQDEKARTCHRPGDTQPRNLLRPRPGRSGLHNRQRGGPLVGNRADHDHGPRRGHAPRTGHQDSGGRGRCSSHRGRLDSHRSRSHQPPDRHRA